MIADTKKLTQEAVELLQNLIRTESISRNEDIAADLLQNYMHSKNLPTHRSGNNIWTIAPDFDESRQTILLNAHIDTVKPSSSYTRNPFEPTIEGDILYGLGSNDDGGGLVSLLQAFRVLKNRKRDYNLVYLASCEEEVSGKNGIESVLPLLPKIDVAIVGEPTGMQPAVAEKGLMVLDVTATGKAGHAARNEGENAIYKALGWIEWFRDYQFEKVSDLLGANKMSVTVINAGTQHNVVPDKCTFVVDVRTNELYSNQEVFDIIKSHVPGAEYRSTRLNSSRISTSHPLIQKLVGMGKKPFGSPTLSDQALMRFPSFKLGPGESSRSHTADEFIKISEIEDAIGTYISLLS